MEQNRESREIFKSLLFYFASFGVGIVIASHAWVECFKFQQGHLMEAPYFLLALFTSALLLGAFGRCCFKKKWIFLEVQFATGARMIFFLGFLLLVYVLALFYAGFLLSTFVYLLVQSLWLRKQANRSVFPRPRIWLQHIIYAVFLTISLRFLLEQLFKIPL